MSIFELDNIQFYYEDDNNGGVPFIFLHGLGGDTKQTMGLLKKTDGLRRISIDFRGHGNTIKYGSESKLSFNQFGMDVISLADHLGLDKFIVGGISTGAGTALNVCLNYPERVEKLILSRPAWEDRPQNEDIRCAFEEIYKILNDDTIVNKKQSFMNTNIYQKLNGIARYAGSTLVGQFDYAHAQETSLKLIKIPNDAPNYNREEWKNIKVPTLILASEQDPIHPYEYGILLSEYIEKSEFKEITPKEVSGQQHNEDSYNFIREFIQS